MLKSVPKCSYYIQVNKLPTIIIAKRENSSPIIRNSLKLHLIHRFRESDVFILLPLASANGVGPPVRFILQPEQNVLQSAMVDVFLGQQTLVGDHTPRFHLAYDGFLQNEDLLDKNCFLLSLSHFDRYNYPNQFHLLLVML